MTAPTRVRRQCVVRQPVATPYVTVAPGGRQPTALAMAAAGLLGRVADRMGRNFATLDKWSQGERGPEHDLDELFPALAAVGIPRDRAALIPARIQALFDAAYRNDIPTLAQLHAPETAVDHAEDTTQMDCVLSDDDLDHQAAHLPNVLAEIAMLQTMAARITKNLHAAGRL
jgi:hypothetical protein